MSYSRTSLFLALPLVMLAACSDPSEPDGDARIRVLLTDEPSDYIASAEVGITRVYLQGGEDADGGAGRIDLFNDEATRMSTTCSSCAMASPPT